jgi:6-phosphofructokinase 1
MSVSAAARGERSRRRARGRPEGGGKSTVWSGRAAAPTSVINSSLAGVFQAAQRRGVGHVYGMVNGIAGFLDGRTVDLNERLQSSLEIELLKRTPSSYLGSCRFKLPDAKDDEEIYRRIFRRLSEMDIGLFFYIGGNDSMDTILKLSDYAAAVGSPVRFMGVPKTIDNDLFETDHTPGYGSAAKYIAVVMKELIRDATVYGTRT